MPEAGSSLKPLINDKLFRLVLHGPPKPTGKRAIVFVHGFIGNAQETWKARDAIESFPSLLAGDPELGDYDVFLFQYVTKDFHPPAIDNIVAQ